MMPKSVHLRSPTSRASAPTWVGEHNNAAMTIEQFLDRDYRNRQPPGDMSFDDLLGEIHNLVDEVPQLSGLISDTRRASDERRPDAKEGARLHDQLDEARRRQDELWVEYNARFGSKPRR